MEELDLNTGAENIAPDMDFGLDLELDLDQIDKEEEWKRLVGQILKGNVIPVINDDMVRIGNSSNAWKQPHPNRKKIPTNGSTVP